MNRPRDQQPLPPVASGLSNNLGCWGLLLLWVVIQVVQTLVAVASVLWGGLSRVQWEDVGIWALAFAVVTGIWFLAYLPFESWVAEPRRRRERVARLRRRAQARAAGEDPPRMEITLGEQEPLAAGRGAASRARGGAHGVASSHSAEHEAPRQVIAGAAAGICPYCQTPVAAGVKIILCPACQTPHHVDCWRENRGCTIYGCRHEPKG